MHTPWGPSQYSRRIADGITFHSTAGHGGILLAMDKFILLRNRFPQFTTYAGGPWFEEDEDQAIVALAFPEHFAAEHLRNAVRAATAAAAWEANHADRFPRWKCVIEWLASDDPIAQDIVRKAEAFNLSHVNAWERGSMSTRGGKWHVSFTRCGDGATRTVLMDYPEKQFYTADEMDALDTLANVAV